MWPTWSDSLLYISCRVMVQTERIYETLLFKNLKKDANIYEKKNKCIQNKRHGAYQLTYSLLFTIRDVQNANHTRYSPVKSYISCHSNSRPARRDALRRCSLGTWFACVITMQRHPSRASKLTRCRAENAINASRSYTWTIHHIPLSKRQLESAN
jgi:hypothetical protein